MKLYAIKRNFEGTKLFEVNVIKEAKKSFKIEDSRLHRSIVNHADLYVKTYNIMFGTDKELLIQKWNEEIELEISRHEKAINELKNMFLSKSS